VKDELTGEDNGWLRFNKGKDRWSFPNVRDDARREAAWKARYSREQMSNVDYFILAESYEALRHLCTHPGGTRYVQRQIAAVRRALIGNGGAK
jgi:hypothetical protein